MSEKGFVRNNKNDEIQERDTYNFQEIQVRIEYTLRSYC